MSKRDEPDYGALCADDAVWRAFRRIADALEGDDIDELAAALSEAPDAWPGPGSHERPKQN